MLANQLVDKYGRDTSKYRKAHKKDHILVSSCAWTSVTTNFDHLRLLWAAKRKFEISTIHSPNHAFIPPHQCTLCISKHSRMATYGGAGVEIRWVWQVDFEWLWLCSSADESWWVFRMNSCLDLEHLTMTVSCWRDYIGYPELELHCWRPSGSLKEELQSFFLGTSSCLGDEDIIFGKASEKRSQLMIVSSGTVSSFLDSFLHD